MTLQSSSGICEEVAISGPSSTSTSSTDVYPLPLSLGRKEIHLDDEEKIVVTDVGHSKVASPGASVTINDSPYARVGDHTAFNGDVTIIQYISSNELPSIQNGAVIEEVECNGTGQVTSWEKKQGTPKTFSQNLKTFLKERPTQLWIAGLLFAVMTSIALITYFSVNFTFTHTPTAVPPSLGHTDDLGDGIQLIQRNEWLARPPLYTIPFTDPPKMVRIMHSAGVNCSDYQNCASRVLGLQGEDVGIRGMPDIAYNYLIGGDAGVYVGRGKNVQSGGRNDTMDIAYIGNYLAPFDQMSDKMEESGKKLIAMLLENGKIAQDYIVVAHNQTEYTTGPGENVYKKIIHWPHYDSGLYFEDGKENMGKKEI